MVWSMAMTPFGRDELAWDEMAEVGEAFPIERTPGQADHLYRGEHNAPHYDLARQM
jgi:hypothetical protein